MSQHQTRSSVSTFCHLSFCVSLQLWCHQQTSRSLFQQMLTKAANNPHSVPCPSFLNLASDTHTHLISFEVSSPWPQTTPYIKLCVLSSCDSPCFHHHSRSGRPVCFPSSSLSATLYVDMQILQSNTPRWLCGNHCFLWWWVIWSEFREMKRRVMKLEAKAPRRSTAVSVAFQRIVMILWLVLLMFWSNGMKLLLAT